jgi:hypothetical protein
MRIDKHAWWDRGDVRAAPPWRTAHTTPCASRRSRPPRAREPKHGTGVSAPVNPPRQVERSDIAGPVRLETDSFYYPNFRWICLRKIENYNRQFQCFYGFIVLTTMNKTVHFRRKHLF